MGGIEEILQGEWLKLFGIIFGGLFSAGGLTVILKYFLDRRALHLKEEVSVANEYREIIDLLKEQNKELKTQEKKNRDEIDKLKKDVSALQSKLLLMESAHHDLTVPAWLKDRDGRMLSFNKVYEEMFIVPAGKNPADYYLATDAEFWGDEIGNEYRTNDLRIERSKKNVRVVEPVLLADGSTEDWIFEKYPRFAGTVYIGMGGIGIGPVNNIMMK